MIVELSCDDLNCEHHILCCIGKLKSHFSLFYFLQEALKGNVLKSREKVRIMCTVGKVLSVMPYQFIMKYLDTVLSPIFSELQDQLCMQKVSFPSRGSFSFIMQCSFNVNFQSTKC